LYLLVMDRFLNVYFRAQMASVPATIPALADVCHKHGGRCFEPGRQDL
jgi:hypothetical protein